MGRLTRQLAHMRVAGTTAQLCDVSQRLPGSTTFWLSISGPNVHGCGPQLQHAPPVKSTAATSTTPWSALTALAPASSGQLGVVDRASLLREHPTIGTAIRAFASRVDRADIVRLASAHRRERATTHHAAAPLLWFALGPLLWPEGRVLSSQRPPTDPLMPQQPVPTGE